MSDTNQTSPTDLQRTSAPLNAFTVDVEDYYQVVAFERGVSPDRWDSYQSRVVENTHRIVDLMDCHEVRGTFFILGWVAERYPQLVREIHARGHEIGSHGYWHRRIYTQTPDEFRDDVQQSKDVIEGIIGQAVTAYRAPCFSITERSLWALEILAELGFTSDSSVFPIYHDRYGIPGARPDIHQIETPSGPLWEFPPSVRSLAKMNLPISGGGYFRLFPLAWTANSIRWLHRTTGRPFMFYIHPWELDPGQPRVSAGTRIGRFRHRVNLASTERKLDRLLSQFRFAPMAEVIERYKTIATDERAGCRANESTEWQTDKSSLAPTSL